MNEREFDNTQEPEMIRYLLGELPEPEAAEFAARYFADDELFEQLACAEAELLDSHARGRLPAPLQARAAARLADSPAYHAELAFARALHEELTATEAAVNEPSPQPITRERTRWQWHWAWATATAVLLLAGGWLWRENRALRRTLAGLRQAQTQREQDIQKLLVELRSVQAQPSPAPPAPRPLRDDETLLARLTLTPDTRRAAPEADLPAVTLRPTTSGLQLRLALNFKPAGGVCTVELYDDAGQRLLRQTRVPARKTAQGFILAWRVNVAPLKAGAYKASVSGYDVERREPVALPFRFRVQRR